MGCVSACFFFRFLSAFCEEASMRVLVRCRMSSVLPLSVEPRTSTFASLMTPGEQENRPDERMRPRARGSGPASEPAGLQVSCLREKGEGTHGSTERDTQGHNKEPRPATGRQRGRPPQAAWQPGGPLARPQRVHTHETLTTLTLTLTLTLIVRVLTCS